MGLVPARRPGWSLDPGRKPGVRGMVAQSRLIKRDGQNPAYRPSGKSSPDAVSHSPNFALNWNSNDAAEEIGRLGIPALAALWKGPRRCEAAPVRPRRLQPDRRPARAQGAAHQRPLVFLRSARRRVQQELELFRGSKP